METLPVRVPCSVSGLSWSALPRPSCRHEGFTPRFLAKEKGRVVPPDHVGTAGSLSKVKAGRIEEEDSSHVEFLLSVLFSAVVFTKLSL